MNKNKLLFEFLAELIDVEIKKYVSLASRGIGPDARLNAALVYDEVNELLFFGKRLLDEIQANKDADQIDDSVFYNLFDQVKFYIEQEHLRAYAGKLLDENNIHTTVDTRTSKQLEVLAEIAAYAEVDLSIRSKPVTEIQKQCQFDSAKIIKCILTLAKKVRENPHMEFDEKIPPHAQAILRRNAATRYHQVAKEIDELYQKCELVLKDSPLEACVSLLTKEEAWAHSAKHQGQLNILLERYKSLEPGSRLFSPTHTWLEVAAISSKAEGYQPHKQIAAAKSLFSSRHVLFGGVIIASSCVLALLSYFSTQLEENYPSLQL
ncbi:hypothetical protein [Legionella clemsonensis]|uniref:Uncharacterized protein n=1 Tax=Legionella clemsonensis TaxID=1867846 RepID=A0A222P2S6_9GAMM|nr:hypothetical protein [Legionella clemsonensis]ASQ46164.1 hypothetical protein clem_08060 [Legionella clemsonensis]